MFVFIVLGVIIIDQLSKYIVLSNMTQLQSIPIIPQVFHLTYIQNPGAAFGVLAHRTSFFIVITILMIIGISIFYFRIERQNYFLRVGLALQVGGAVGNLIDRVRLGKVVDFLDFRVWPIFNLADSAIVIGVALICWEIIKSEKKEKEI